MRADGQPTFERYVTTADWAACADWSVYDRAVVLLNTPQDASTFYARTEHTRQQAIMTLTRWWREHHGGPGAGFAGLFLLTLIALEVSELRRSTREPEQEQPHDDQVCQELLEDPDVRSVLLEVYAPEDEAEAKAWRRLRPESLRFHRHGTTSFILRARLVDRDLDLDQPCAVKCLIYPFLRIPTIARATSGYAERYRQRTAGREHLVHVLASAENWILMDFVDGHTLAEELEARASLRSGIDPDLDMLEEFGTGLFAALSELNESGLQHHDLTPSNIIVTRDSVGRLTLRLVDLGANYLYVQNMPGQAGTDVQFAAPEVRTGSGIPGSRSDLYSLGQLLLLVGSGSLGEDNRVVPSVWYARAPQLARFVEDLIDTNPAHRLLVFSGPSGSGPSHQVDYRDLWRRFLAELAEVRVARTDRIAAHVTVSMDLKRMVLPFDGAPKRLWRLWRGMRKARPGTDDYGHGGYQRWLLVWSLLSVLVGAVLTALILLWTYRQLGLEWDNQLIFLLRNITGAAEDEFPFVDAFRVPGYALPESVPSVLFALMAFSTVLVGVRYYQSLFADLTPARIGRGGGRLFVHAIAVEVITRSWAFVPVLMVGPPLLVQPRWWPVFGAIGLSMVSLTNWLTSSYGRAVARAAQRGDRRLSTVPASIEGVAAYTEWLPGTYGYTLLVAGIAGMLTMGWADDHGVYLAMIAAVNLYQLYWVKCGREGPVIRAGLVQASIAAERLRALRDSLPPTQPFTKSEPKRLAGVQVEAQ